MKTEQRALESKASCGFGATQVFSMHITGLYSSDAGVYMQVCVCVDLWGKNKERKPRQKQTNERLPQPPLHQP